MVVKILDMTKRDSISTSFPKAGLRMVGTIKPTPEEAHAEGVKALKAYEAVDPFGNMGDVPGVAAVEGGYRAVINTYHSNT
jgi:hypothetical protein